MDAATEALRNADQLIAALLTSTGLNYSAHRQQLATEIWDEGHWEGNSDITVTFEDGLRSLRAIQEDEWDQHMDEDEDRPTWEKMLHSNPVYVWFADDTK